MSFNVNDRVKRVNGPSNSTTVNTEGTIIFIRDFDAKDNKGNIYKTIKMHCIQFDNGAFECATEDQIRLVNKPSVPTVPVQVVDYVELVPAPIVGPLGPVPFGPAVVAPPVVGPLGPVKVETVGFHPNIIVDEPVLFFP
jgi:hypothetical protein